MLRHHSFGAEDISIGLESKLLRKTKTFNITEGDFIVTESLTDVAAVYIFDMRRDDINNLFRSLRNKESNLRLTRFQGYYIPLMMNATVGAKKFIVNNREMYQDMLHCKKEIGATAIVTNISSLKQMSYLYDDSSYFTMVKSKLTSGSQVMVPDDAREDIIAHIKDIIKQSNDIDKILYFKGPFLKDTGIGVTIINSQLRKSISPLVYLLHWFLTEPEEFKKFLLDNKISIVLDNNTRSSIVIPCSEKFLNMKTFNFKVLIRLIHKLDGTIIQELEDDPDAMIEEPEVIDGSIKEKEVIAELTGNPIDKSINRDEPTEEDELKGDIEDAFLDDLSTESEAKAKFTKEKIDNIFKQAETDSDIGIEIMELHNYTELKKNIETPLVTSLRKKMLKKYDSDTKSKVDLVKKHKTTPITFNNTVDNDFNKSTFIGLENSYIEKLQEEDFIQALMSPSNLSIPLFLKSYEKTDISDREFRGYTLKVTYETIEGQELEVELDIPTIKNGAMFIGGSSKYLTNQNLAKPIIKVDDNVIITMSYNKSILSIKGKYASVEQKSLISTMKEFSKYNDSFIVKTTEDLSDFIYENRMSYEMLSINKHYLGVRCVLGHDIYIDFRGISKEENGLSYCGLIDKKKVHHNPEKDIWTINDLDERNSDEFIKYLMNTIDTDLFYKCHSNAIPNTNGVNSIYATIMAREIPIVFIMLVETPLKTLLERLRDENELEFTAIRNTKLDVSKLKNDNTYGYIILQDYTIRVKYNNQINMLILLPLVQEDLTKYTAMDISEIISNMVGSKNTSIYLENFVTSFIQNDIRILEMFNMPTDFTGVWIYAAGLFYNYKTYTTSNASNYRLVTTPEVINRILFDTLAKECGSNAARVKRGSKQSINIPKDSLIRTIQSTMSNISEDSNISPFRTIGLKSSVSQKGFVGVNMDRAFGLDRRAFDNTNYGTETFATAYSGSAGVVKFLPMNPLINDLTGSYNNTDNPLNLEPSALFGMSDSYIPYTTFDDGPRRLMLSGQMLHVVGIEGADPMLLSTGFDEAAAYMSPEFSYVADGDGEVLDINDKFVTIKYADKSLGTVVYRLDNVEKNAAKGYFMKNDFTISKKLRLNKKIKKGELLAYNKNFFKEKNNGAISLCGGALVPVILIDGEGTWEDACIVSEHFSKKAAMKIVKQVSILIDMATTEIKSYSLDIGGSTEPGSELFTFKTLTEDESLNEFFSDVESINTHTKYAKYKGTLNDIVVYYRNSKKNQMHPSIKKFLSDISVVQENKGNMKSISKSTSNFNRATATSMPQELKRGKFSKINGTVIENGYMLINYMIEVTDNVGPSDKIVIDRMLKGETTFVIKDEDRPTGVLTGRKADIQIDTQCVNARKAPGIALHGKLIGILLHMAIKSRMMLNIPPEKDSLLDYKSSMDMVEGKLKYK